MFEEANNSNLDGLEANTPVTGSLSRWSKLLEPEHKDKFSEDSISAILEQNKVQCQFFQNVINEICLF